MSTSTSDTGEPLPLRRNREYMTWMTGDLLLEAGGGVAAFAFPLVTLYATGSAEAVGIVGLVEGLGVLGGMLPGGVLADRVDRKRLRLLSAGFGALLQALLIAILVLGAASVPLLAVLAFADRFRAGVLGSASGAMLKQIVPPAQLPRAFAINEGRGAAIELGAGPLGGALLALHLAAPSLLLVLGQLSALVSTLLLRGDYRPRALDAPGTTVRADLREALRWAVGQQMRLQLLTVGALVNFGLNGVLLTVGLQLAIVGMAPARIGLLATALAVSILVGALIAPRIVEKVPTGAVVLVALGLLAAAAAAVPFASGLIGYAALYAVMGIGLAPANAAIQGFLLHITPTAMQGRVMSLNGLVALGLMPLMPMAAGWGLAHVGPRTTLLVFAGVCVLALAIAALGPHLRRVPAAPLWDAHARAEGLSTS